MRKFYTYVVINTLEDFKKYVVCFRVSNDITNSDLSSCNYLLDEIVATAMDISTIELALCCPLTHEEFKKEREKGIKRWHKVRNVLKKNGHFIASKD